MASTTCYQWKNTKNSKKCIPETPIVAQSQTKNLLSLNTVTDETEMKNIENNYDLLDFEESLYNEDPNFCLPKCLLSQDSSASITIAPDNELNYEQTDISWVDDSNTDPMKMVSPNDAFGQVDVEEDIYSSVFMSPAQSISSPACRSRSNSVDILLSSPIANGPSSTLELIEEFFKPSVSNVKPNNQVEYLTIPSFAYSPVSPASSVSSTNSAKKTGRKRKQQSDDDYEDEKQHFKKTKNAAAAARYRAKKANESDHWQQELDVHMQEHETLVKKYNEMLTKRNILMELNYEKFSGRNVLFPEWVHRLFSKK
ncbi:hypothetical protein HDE_12665 [Halotydeus destructor]|nr:hypothetical protein HDE_12665 [Halotydeus destructor]